MTITHRKRQPQPPEEIQSIPFHFPRLSPANPKTALIAVTEPGLQIECDSCRRDLTHSVRIKCADPVCAPGDGVDICPSCFCSGREFARHRRDHQYRVVVWNRLLPPLNPPTHLRSQELHSYPILTEDWGADEYVALVILTYRHPILIAFLQGNYCCWRAFLSRAWETGRPSLSISERVPGTRSRTITNPSISILQTGHHLCATLQFSVRVTLTIKKR